MPDDEQVDFFVSYTGRDEDWARWVSRVLEEHGYRVIVQARDFKAGNFVLKIEDALRATWLVPVLSEAYLKSRWGLRESFAYLHSKPDNIIPVQVEDIERPSLLLGYNRVNLGGLKESAAAARLLERMEEFAGAPTQLPRAWDGSAAFPEKIRVVGAGPDDAAPPADHPSRIVLDDGRLQLVLLGTDTALAALPDLLAARPGRILDLHDDDRPASAQLDAVRSALAEDDDDPVSDVVVVFAGPGSVDPTDGTRLWLLDGWIRYGDLLDVVKSCAPTRRVHVVLDAADGAGTSVIAAGAVAEPTVGVLDLRRPAGSAGTAGGLSGVVEALRRAPAEPHESLRHWAPLALDDLAALSGGSVHAAAHWPGHDVGLLANPLAWPTPSTDVANWCVVLSATASAGPTGCLSGAVNPLQDWKRGRLSASFGERRPGFQLDDKAGEVRAAEVFASPRSFARAVEQVCRAEIALFDLTNYEPAVMVLLGIRAVIRRGVTLCLHDEHAEPWYRAEPPFHLREISMLDRPSVEEMTERLIAGIRQFLEAGHAYSDLPAFELLRGIPPDPNRRGTRPYDMPPQGSILSLVPFDPDYTRTHWTHLQQNLPEGARMSVPAELQLTLRVRLERTLDLDSPRIVPAQLFEHIRLVDFCLVDLTTLRPNVLFELGVRLAASRLHPVVVRDPDLDPGGAEPWQVAHRTQTEQLSRLLAVIEYSPTADSLDHIREMVARHVELRRLDAEPAQTPHPRERTVLGGFPPRGVHDLAWSHADPAEEIVSIPVSTRLAAAGDSMLLDPGRGSSHLLYPKRHELSRVAQRCGREYLVAAWLYRHFRGGDAEATEDVTERLLGLLRESGDPADATFAARIAQWRAEKNGDEP